MMVKELKMRRVLMYEAKDDIRDANEYHRIGEVYKKQEEGVNRRQWIGGSE